MPRYGWDVEPPIKPGPDGNYPAILPGITKLAAAVTLATHPAGRRP